MPGYRILPASIVIAALLTATPASASAAPRTEPVRSGASLPAKKEGAARTLPVHVGPKDGFHDNHGFREAWEHASEHSAGHRRGDSPG